MSNENLSEVVVELGNFKRSFFGMTMTAAVNEFAKLYEFREPTEVRAYYAESTVVWTMSVEPRVSFGIRVISTTA